MGLSRVNTKNKANHKTEAVCHMHKKYVVKQRAKHYDRWGKKPDSDRKGLPHSA